MAGLLENETAVVTGGASGNGRAIATRFAEEGASVVIADLHQEDRKGGKPTHKHINDDTESEAAYIQCDVTDFDDLSAAVDKANDFGGLDIMVNNAGIAFKDKKSVAEISPEEYDQMLDINLRGVFLGCQVAAGEMRSRDQKGNIINMSSIGGLKGGAKNSIYNISKAGVKILTQSLAAELGPHSVRVNAIHPGIIDTAFTTEDISIISEQSGEEYKQSTPLGRFGTPEDVGDAAVFLASDLSSFVTGHSLIVDGGLTTTS